MTTICEPDVAAARSLQSHLGEGRVVTDLAALTEDLQNHGTDDALVLGPSVPLGAAVQLAETMRVLRPWLGVVVVRAVLDVEAQAQALRAGVREVVALGDVPGLQAAVRRAHEQSAQHRSTAPLLGSSALPGRVITVFSAKGGCGKTTVATNLAAALAERGRRAVCLVDLDLSFGDVAISLQLFPTHTLGDAVAHGSHLTAESLQTLLTRHSPGLSTLAAPVEPGSAETIPASLVTHVLELLRDSFDVVVVDTPPAFDDQVLAAFDVSDVIVLVATLDIPAIKNLKVALDTMALLSYPNDRWRVVLNRADSKVGLSVAEVERTLQLPIAAQIPSSRDVPAAINRGVPIVLDDPRHPVSLAIMQFASQHVATQLAGHAAPQVAIDLRTDRRGFLRRRSRA